MPERPLEGVLDWLAVELPAVRDVEIGTGGYAPAAHCDRERLLADDGLRRDWLVSIESRDFRLAALNVSGNPLEQPEHDRALRETIALAGLLGVERVVCMSGGRPELSGGAWFPGVEDDVERYWTERVLPYWRELAASGVLLCFELEPGAAAFNVSTVERLLELGPGLAVNLDPSHFFWQSIDPLAAIRRLAGRIGFAHAKDTVVDPERLAVDGRLDRTAWRYATAGHGRGADWWRDFGEELRRAGYDGVVSVEYEDPQVPAEASVAEAAQVLTQALAEEVVR
ncbi:MAG: sugar phosphate isomerase/epimerase [Thermoleophilia bacterium]|nr:sugar phosphate isomerase/epimerase [Thermoleophilia bacterium]